MTESLEILPAADDDRVRLVCRALIDHGLGRGASLFDPTRQVWSAARVAELYRRYNEQPDLGTDTFLVKLQRQIGKASDDVILLTAELLTLHALPLRNLTQAKKRERINHVLGWMQNPPSIPAEVDGAFAQSTWHGGTGAHTMLWRWLANAVGLVGEWWTLSEAERTHALADPWAWRDLVQRVATMPTLREGLLYLAFPSQFLPIINTGHKAAIRKAFGYRLADATGDLDRDLFEITVGLQAETGQPVNFYQPPFVQEWRGQVDRGGERRAWLVRPRQGGPDLVKRWKADGFVSLAATHLGELPLGADQPTVRTAVEGGYQHLEYAQRVSLANEYHAFLSRMEIDDIVATVAEDRLSVGVVTGDPEYDPSADGARLRRPVEWLDAAPTAVDSLPSPLPAELDQQGTVVDLTGALEALSTLMTPTTDTGAPPEQPGGAATALGTPNLPAATDQLAARVHIDREWLQELIDLLQERSQVVLYGPPGTGKTFLAQTLGRHLAQRDAVRLVQFHPSYAYEDFFEGFRPVEGADGGAVGFAKTPGPLREVAAEARANPEQPYMLIVDEINRANLAKVFGELYFLLEYRHDAIRLQYSPSEAFRLPPNVFFIGTMNTADRSIALVDAAIRRRFAFVELHPDEPPVRDVLRNWLAANDKAGDKRADLLSALNESIGEEDHDFKIGPSYLMKPHLEAPGGLERVWRHDLLPLLEDHYYGRLTRAQVRSRFGLDAIRRRLAVAQAEEGPQPATDNPPAP